MNLKQARLESKKIAQKAVKGNVDPAKFNARIRKKYGNDALTLVKGKNPYIKGFAKMMTATTLDDSIKKPKSALVLNLEEDLKAVPPTPPPSPVKVIKPIIKSKKRPRSFFPKPVMHKYQPVYKQHSEIQTVPHKTRPLVSFILKNCGRK